MSEVKPDEQKELADFMNWYRQAIEEDCSHYDVEIIFDYFKRYHVEPLQKTLSRYSSQEVQISNLQSEITRLKKENWISVKDRLPEKDGFVIVSKSNLLVLACYFFTNDKSFMYSDVEQTDQITHWQPLPEPPSLGPNQ